MLKSSFLAMTLIGLHTSPLYATELDETPTIRIDAKELSNAIESADYGDQLSDTTLDAFHEFGPLAAELGLTAYILKPYDFVLFTYDNGKHGEQVAEHVFECQAQLESRLKLEDRRPLSGGAGFHVRNLDAYDQIIDALVSAHPYLENWAPTAKNINGFAIYHPSVFAVVEDERADRRVNLFNLIVHQATLVAVDQHFGFQPFWIREGLALDLEATVTDQLYAFAMSDEFVPEKRPKAWRRDMAKSWRRAKSKDFDVLFRMTNEVFNRTRSLRAMGLVRHLSTQYPEEFAGFLDALNQDRNRGIQIEGNYMPDEIIQSDLLAAALGLEWKENSIPELQKVEKSSKSKSNSTVTASKKSRRR